MHGISTIPFPHIRRVHGARTHPATAEEPTEAERIVEHLVDRAVLRPDSPAASLVHRILATPPEALRVRTIARRAHLSRRTLARRFQAEGVPAPVDWTALARALWAHRSILRGRLLRDAALVAGYPDQFTMSNAIHRITGLRPSRLQEVSRTELLDTWIAWQRRRGTLTGPPPVSPPTCPLCGGLRAS